MNHLEKREFHWAPSFVSSSAFSVSHFQVNGSTNRSLCCQGVGQLLHDCVDLHVVAWSSCQSVLLPAALGQECLRLFLCRQQFNGSSFCLRPEEFWLGLRPDLSVKQRAKAVLSQEVLHISGRFKDVYSRQHLVC